MSDSGCSARLEGLGGASLSDAIDISFPLPLPNSDLRTVRDAAPIATAAPPAISNHWHYVLLPATVDPETGRGAALRPIPTNQGPFRSQRRDDAIGISIGFESDSATGATVLTIRDPSLF